MPYIGTQPLTGQFKKLDAITVVNGQAAYTMNYNSAAYKPATANALLVSVNGVIQAAGDAYTINGSTITFTENLVTGDTIDFIIALGDTGSAVTPVDGSVTTAKLANDAVTSAKLADGAVTTAKLPTGSVLQVVSTEKSDSFTTTSSSFVDVTGMSATITPSSTSSKILVFFNVGLIGNDTIGQFSYLKLVRGSTDISIGDTAGSRTRVSAGVGGDQAYENSPASIHILDSPATASAVTYKIQMKTQTSGTAKFNSLSDNNDSAAYSRSSASLTLMEIAG